MAIVKTFNRAMIENYLREKDLNYFQDRDGDFQLRWSYDEECGCQLTVWFLLFNDSVYQITIVSDKQIPRQDWGKTMLLCNTWNQERRWPKAFLYIENPETDKQGSINLREAIDLQEGVHQELFDDWTTTVISASFAFWKWAHQEKGL